MVWNRKKKRTDHILAVFLAGLMGISVFPSDAIITSAEEAALEDDIQVKPTAEPGNLASAKYALTAEEWIPEDNPTIEVNYLNDPDYVEKYDDVAYYDTARTAEIIITGRSSIFEKNIPEIEVTAVDYEGIQIEGTYEISDWVTKEPSEEELKSGSKTRDDAIHIATIAFHGSANYTFSVNYTNMVEEGDSGFCIGYDSGNFAVDLDDPAGEIAIDSNKWSQLIETLTFHLWKNTSVEVVATAKDATSPIKSVEYYKTDSTAALTEEELEEIDDWTSFDGLTILCSEQFTVYLKITDYAGRYSYISSDGYVVEDKKSGITVTLSDSNENGYYNADVGVTIQVKEETPYSGIQKIEYWVTCDGKNTAEETLYEFAYTENGTLAITDWASGKENITKEENIGLTHDKLTSQWEGNITVNAQENNSDHVKVYVKVTDNAGNVSVYESEEFKIDVTIPKIQIEFDENDPYFTAADGREYYGDSRTATVSITERTSSFDEQQALDGITFSGTDSSGESVALIREDMIAGPWITTEGDTPDEAVHKITVVFTADANYVFGVSYTDQAGNPCDYADGTEERYLFTVDQNDPAAKIRVAENTWTKLLEVLTFGLWSNDGSRYKVSAEAWDETSPVTIAYYISNGDVQLTEKELEDIPEEKWISYKAFTVDSEQQFAVYLRVTDYAGNRIYINSDGHILDQTGASITVTPDTTDITHNGVGVYNGDVNVRIDVAENEIYSGIRTVEYWVLCDGEETQREMLYSCDYKEAPTKEELTFAFSKTITVEAGKNNSCDVVLYVGVMDNAGNYEEKSIALDIDITAPTIQITYDNNDAYKVADNNGYFPEKRNATVVITERTGHFEAAKATGGIQITAKDGNGRTVIADCSSLIGSWKTSEGAAADAATHTAVISYSADANYTFAIRYTDLAGNKNTPVDTADSVTPYSFTVDKTAPTGTITVGTLGTWDKLIKTLTFGLWSRSTVKVSGTSADATSPIESVSYYKTADTAAKTLQQLRNIQEWKTFSGFQVKANEQFTVYLRIVDSAGNTTYISTDGVIVDNTKPVVESVKPKITITPEQPVNGIYSTDVKVAVKVEDPKSGETNAYSGLKEIRYEIYSMGELTQEGILYSFTQTAPTQSQLCQVWKKEAAILVDKTLNNSNDVSIRVYAADNAGNASEAAETIKIDITDPVIEVRYDNNDGDTTFADGSTDAFFKASRTATITVTERNFDPEKVLVTIANTDGVNPEISGWTTRQGAGNGDSTTHTATITYSADGDYNFSVSCTDLAGNGNKTVDYGNSLAPTKFTVDKTLPMVSVSYDNNDVQNGNYYKDTRTATITITEHNFEASRVKVTITAVDDGNAVSVPSVSSWTGRGDVHTATITYSADALYTFDFAYEDKAGNAAAKFAAQSFYVDKTDPVVAITNIVDESANNAAGNIGFIITATDTNFDVFIPVLTAVIKEGDSFVTKQLEVGRISDITNGKVYTVTNLEADGIYRISCTVVDKAGNAYSEIILTASDGSAYVENRTAEDTLVSFSVNREGSVFEIDQNTTELVEKYYVRQVGDDLVIFEINADPLQGYEVTLNGKILKENTDYTVTAEGGDGKWMKYIYTIDKSLFAEEGEYKLVISSKDKAENDTFSDVKNATISFVVDRTAPIVTVTGLASNGRYQTEKQKVTLIPTDDGGALKSLIVRLVDSDGSILKELINLEGDELAQALEEGAGKIIFEIEEGLYQNVQIICSDYAVDENGDTNIYDEIFTNVSVSSSAFMIFWANKPLGYGVMAGILLAMGGLILIIVLKKRKKKEE